LGKKLFHYRGALPVPFVAVILAMSQFSIGHFVYGLLLIIAGESLRVWAVGYIGRESRVTGRATAPRLCNGGPYGFTRNPLYLANITIYSGFAGLSNILSPWFPMSVFVIYGVIYGLIVRYEEECLQKTLGNEFVIFTRQVPRWFPRFRPLLPKGPVAFSITTALKSERWTFAAILAMMAGIVIRWAVG